MAARNPPRPPQQQQPALDGAALGKKINDKIQLKMQRMQQKLDRKMQKIQQKIAAKNAKSKQDRGEGVQRHRGEPQPESPAAPALSSASRRADSAPRLPPYTPTPAGARQARGPPPAPTPSTQDALSQAIATYVQQILQSVNIPQANGGSNNQAAPAVVVPDISGILAAANNIASEAVRSATSGVNASTAPQAPVASAASPSAARSPAAPQQQGVDLDSDADSDGEVDVSELNESDFEGFGDDEDEAGKGDSDNE